jgi:hypothetical protein
MRAREYVLITGASEGLGREFAKLFAADRFPIVLVARNHSRLAEIARELSSLHGVDVRIIAKDLSRPGAAQEIKEELDGQAIAVGTLVNNAGCGIHGPFDRSDWKATEAMLSLNIMALTHLTRLLLPGMIARASGKVLNVASTAAFQPGPFMACYFASKAYVLSFTEALSGELSGTGVTATAFCPGPVKTQFQKRSGTEHIRENAFAMEAGPAARMAYRDMMKGKRIVIPGFFNKLLAFLVRITPRGLVLKVTRFLEKGKTPS